jgi:hypothetical protein
LFDKNYIKVINKSDLTQKSQAKGIRVSAKNNNIVNLIKALLKRLQTKLD